MNPHPLYHKAYTLTDFIQVASDTVPPVKGGIVENALSCAMAFYMIPRIGMEPIIYSALEGPESAGESLGKMMCGNNYSAYETVKDGYNDYKSWRKVLVNLFNMVYVDYCSMYYSPFFVPDASFMVPIYQAGLIPATDKIRLYPITESSVCMLKDGYAMPYETTDGAKKLYVSYTYFEKMDMGDNFAIEMRKAFPNDYQFRWFDIDEMYKKAKPGYFPSVAVYD